MDNLILEMKTLAKQLLEEMGGKHSDSLDTALSLMLIQRLDNLTKKIENLDTAPKMMELK